MMSLIDECINGVSPHCAYNSDISCRAQWKLRKDSHTSPVLSSIGSVVYIT